MENAIELINRLKPNVYCYLGSGMLTNTYDEGVALSNAKKQALICIQAQIDLLNDMYSDMDYGQSVRNYLDNKVEELTLIKTEIEKL